MNVRKLSLFKRTLLVFLPLLFTVACGTAYKPPAEEEAEVSSNNPVPPDGRLEAVTWNVEWYGHNSRGPDDEILQTQNVLHVADSLKADLYAFQEIYSQEALNDLIHNMEGYSGFVGDHISWVQKTAFVYNTNTIDSLAAGPITNVRHEYKEDWEYYWANGRLPLYFHFNYTFEGTTKEFYAIVIHGKANTGSNSAEYKAAYERRQNAAEGLYYYLMDEKPEANIILLGDYNDDVDQSIYYEEENGERVYQETPYDEFVEDTDNFDVITKKLSDTGESASINYSDIIDHITISDELFNFHIDNSTKVYDKAQSFIPSYGNTTSDHYPVWTTFDVTLPNSGENDY